MDRLKYEDVIELSHKWRDLETQYKVDGGWIRCAETDKYFYDSHPITCDHRIVDKQTNTEVYSYYTDFYTG